MDGVASAGLNGLTNGFATDTIRKKTDKNINLSINAYKVNQWLLNFIFQSNEAQTKNFKSVPLRLMYSTCIIRCNGSKDAKYYTWVF
jgi:hypothetical protein